MQTCCNSCGIDFFASDDKIRISRCSKTVRQKAGFLFYLLWFPICIQHFAVQSWCSEVGLTEKLSYLFGNRQRLRSDSVRRKMCISAISPRKNCTTNVHKSLWGHLTCRYIFPDTDIGKYGFIHPPHICQHVAEMLWRSVIFAGTFLHHVWFFSFIRSCMKLHIDFFFSCNGLIIVYSAQHISIRMRSSGIPAGSYAVRRAVWSSSGLGFNPLASGIPAGQRQLWLTALYPIGCVLHESVKWFYTL